MRVIVARLAAFVLIAGLALLVASSMGRWDAGPLLLILLILGGGALLVGYALAARGFATSRRSADPLLDPTLQPLDLGTPHEMLAGRGALGGGAGGSAAVRAAMVRSVWHEPQPGVAITNLRWRVDPDPAPSRLATATRKGLKAAKRALSGRGEVRVTGDLMNRPGPDLVSIRIVVRGQTDDPGEWMRRCADAFAETFERRLDGHRLERVA